MEKVKKIITNLLLIFALISIGFMLGKNSVKTLNKSGDMILNGEENYIAVYYMHSTFRCVTCNTIEKMTKELLNDFYTKEMTKGNIKFIEVDFQENNSIAQKFEVVSSCVVVANIQKGSIVEYRRLDEVWELMKKPKEFNNYIGNIINLYLEKVENN